MRCCCCTLLGLKRRKDLEQKKGYRLQLMLHKDSYIITARYKVFLRYTTYTTATVLTIFNLLVRTHSVGKFEGFEAFNLKIWSEMSHIGCVSTSSFAGKKNNLEESGLCTLPVPGQQAQRWGLKPTIFSAVLMVD